MFTNHQLRLQAPLTTRNLATHNEVKYKENLMGEERNWVAGASTWWIFNLESSPALSYLPLVFLSA